MGTARPGAGTLPQRLIAVRTLDDTFDETFFDPAFHALDGSLMDCRSFRKHHLAYLDDTLSGDETGAAQRHVLACDACAAHDTLVRRSLMIARSLPSIEPTSEFSERLRARLAECREDRRELAASAASASDVQVSRTFALRSPRTFATMAACTALGALAWTGFTSSEAAVIAMQPVVASQPAAPAPNPYITPALMQAMATGNPVWPAAVLIEDVPTHFVTVGLDMAGEIR